MDPLFPALPEDLNALSADELAALLQEHESAADLIDAEDEDFIKGMGPDEVLAAYETGVEQIDAIKAEQQSRIDAENAYLAKKAELAARRKPAEADEPEGEGEDGDEEKPAEVLASDDEAEKAEDEDEVVEEKEEDEALVAAAAPTVPAVRMIRPAPRPSPERDGSQNGTVALVAAGGLQETRAGSTFRDLDAYAAAVIKEAKRIGRPAKHARGTEERYMMARAEYQFPDELVLKADDPVGNSKKIKQIVPQSVPGMPGSQALVASGGLCAPLTPLYTMPNFASQARPVRDALPSFNADRGGVNVPAATYIGDIITPAGVSEAITIITEAEDAQGGTFATKSCMDLDCPTYTETAVTIISHCREFGNLLARSWPEKVAHENELTMAAHARAAESYLLDGIKALSVNVTNGVETLGALIYIVDAIVKASFGIRGRLRMDPQSRFKALLPFWAVEMLMLDTIQTQFDRFKSRGEITSYLASFGIDVTYYLDSPSTGTTQLPDASQTAAAIDGLPDTVQWALFPQGAFIHVDGGSLELGLVRDSTLNSTNDFQFFGETFENVARIAPAQAAYWITSDVCPTGQFPPAGTVRTCE